MLGRFGVNMRVMVSGKIRDRYGGDVRVWVRDMVGASFMTGYSGRFVVIFRFSFRHKVGFNFTGGFGVTVRMGLWL